MLFIRGHVYYVIYMLKEWNPMENLKLAVKQKHGKYRSENTHDIRHKFEGGKERKEQFDKDSIRNQ